MTFLILTILIPIITAILLWKILNIVLLRPKKIEKLLRQQGINGNSYKLFVGDVVQVYNDSKAALLKPISLSDDHLPRIAGFFYNTVQKYGNICFAWIGPVPWLIISEPEKIKEVVTRYEDFQKPNHPFTQLLLVGLVGLEGKTWAKRRRIINPAFHIEKLKHMFPAVCESGKTMISSWEDLMTEDNSATFDVWPHVEFFIGDAISRSAFGSSNDETRKIIELINEQVNLSVYDPQPSNYIPGWRFLPTKKNRRVKEICKEVERLLTKMIDTRKKEMEEGEENKNDLLGLLLKSGMDEIKAQDNKDEIGLTTSDVVQECKVFYMAGSETTSSLLVWALVLLSKYQNWQDRAREEVLKVFGKDGKPTYEGVSQLKIVTAILQEVLRLYSPVYTLIRKVHKDTKLGELFIPAGTELLLPICMVHLDCGIWGKDAKEFNPERFLEGVAKATKGQAIYFPFSVGPRFCIGQNFSLMETKIALTMILQRFSLDLSPTYVHAPFAILSVKPQFGANLLVKRL